MGRTTCQAKVRPSLRGHRGWDHCPTVHYKSLHSTNLHTSVDRLGLLPRFGCALVSLLPCRHVQLARRVVVVAVVAVAAVVIAAVVIAAVVRQPWS